MIYEHSQTNLVIPGLMAIGAVVMAVLLVVTGEIVLIVGLLLFGLIALLGFALSRLRVTVSADAVEVGFRWRPKREIARSDILRAEIVRNKWWYGWGVRWIPGGVMWNVWGLDAVHLDLAGRRGFRIGTDDPEGLAGALAATGLDSGVDGCWPT